MGINIIQQIIDGICSKDKNMNQLMEGLEFINALYPIDVNLLELIKKSRYEDAKKLVQDTYDKIDPQTLPLARGKLREHQIKLLDVTKSIIKGIEGMGLHPITAGGTALGLIRHHGYIPWDDDIDFDLMREEYDEFLSYVKENEIFVDIMDCKSNGEYLLRVDEILKKNPNKAVFVEKWSCTSAFWGSSIENCVILDFFPRDYLNPSFEPSKYVEYMNKKVPEFDNYKKRRTYREYFEFFRNEYENQDIFSKGKSKLTVYSWGNISFNHYFPSILALEDVYPLKRMKFEDTEFYIVNNYDKYLRDIYKDYMKIPAILYIAKYVHSYSKSLKKIGKKYYISVDDFSKA